MALYNSSCELPTRSTTINPKGSYPLTTEKHVESIVWHGHKNDYSNFIQMNKGVESRQAFSLIDW